MTRAEAKAAMDAGKKIGWSDSLYKDWICSHDLDHPRGPYIVTSKSSGETYRMSYAWDQMDTAYIIPERKTRPCNQLEILAIQTKPNRVVREKDCHEDIVPAQYWKIGSQESIHLEWAELGDDGNLGPWHDFVVEEEV